MKSTPHVKSCSVPLALLWSHAGVLYRVTPWPEVRFERLYGSDWVETSPNPDVMASSAQDCGPEEWQSYLEFVPTEQRTFLELFSFCRMEALQAIARCPALLAELTERPVLTAFIAAHRSLRGTPIPGWHEINAVYERSGVFGVLEWLGLPASRQTLSILHNIAEPDLPKRFLEPLRSLLWDPTTMFALQRMSAITDRKLADACHALAA